MMVVTNDGSSQTRGNIAMTANALAVSQLHGDVMSNIAVGKKLPDFSLPSTGDKTFFLSAQEGKKTVLYFYPKDNTPGCTSEGQDFRDLYPEFVGASGSGK